MITFQQDLAAEEIAVSAATNLNSQYEVFWNSLQPAEQAKIFGPVLVSHVIGWDVFDMYQKAPTADLFPYVACYFAERTTKYRTLNLDFCFWLEIAGAEFIGGLMAKTEQIMRRSVRGLECISPHGIIQSEILVRERSFPTARLTFEVNQ